MSLSSKQLVTVVCAVCATIVLAPVGVLAATGQLVNITDPTYSTRKARVGSAGTLQVESRAGVPTGGANVVALDIQSLTPQRLVQFTGPDRAAISEITVGVHKNGTPVDAPTILDVVYYARVSGTAACGLSGWTGTTLRRISLRTDTTEQVAFDGPPLIVPRPASGQVACVAAKLYQWVGQTKVDVGATVWTFQS